MWNEKELHLLYTGWTMWPWPHPWPWHCSFMVKVWNSLIWGMRGLIDMERKGCESIIHDHDCDLWVTMVGWVDVRCSDWGDFRRRHAVDISSFDLFCPFLSSKKAKKYHPQGHDFKTIQVPLTCLQIKFHCHSKIRFDKVAKNLNFDLFWTFLGSQRAPDHVSHTHETTSYIPVNQVSWTHSKNFFQKMAKNLNLDLFLPILWSKGPKNITFGGHDLHNVKAPLICL